MVCDKLSEKGRFIIWLQGMDQIKLKVIHFNKMVRIS